MVYAVTEYYLQYSSASVVIMISISQKIWLTLTSSPAWLFVGDTAMAMQSVYFLRSFFLKKKPSFYV